MHLALTSALLLQIASAAEPVAERPVEPAPDDASRVRTLFADTAFSLSRNEFLFSQTELVASQLEWGATDWLSFRLGSALPTWFFPPFASGVNFAVSAKATGAVTPLIRLGGGLRAWWLPTADQRSTPLVASAFVVLSVGTEHRSLTASAAVPVSGFGGLNTGSPLFTLSGQWRVTSRFALVSENWLIVAMTTEQSRSIVRLLMVNGLAVRLSLGRFSCDLGLAAFSQNAMFTPVPLPWLNFSYAFSL